MTKLISILLISTFMIACSGSYSKQDKRKQDILSSINIYEEEENQKRQAKERTEIQATPTDTSDYQEDIILPEDTVVSEDLTPSILEEIEEEISTPIQAQ